MILVIILLCMLLGKKREDGGSGELKTQFNEYLARIMEDGTYDQMRRIWLEEDGKGGEIDFSALTGENGILRFGTTTSKPFSYLVNNRRAGFTIDMVYRFCIEKGYGMEIEDFNTNSALVTAVQTGRCDFGGNNLSMTDDRKEKIDFSDPYFDNKLMFALHKSKVGEYSTCYDLEGKTLGTLSGTSLDVRLKEVLDTGPLLEYNSLSDLCEALDKGKIEAFCFDETVLSLLLQEYPDLREAFYLDEKTPDRFGLIFPKTGDVQDGGFLARTENSFYRTFIEGDRYVLLLEGIWSTFLITVLSVLFGTALGFLIFIITDRDNIIIRIASVISDGLPAVVLLMIFYYIVFGNTKLNGTAVSVIVFSCTFAMSVISILGNATDAIDPGQYEASTVLGYSKTSAFFRIILPQALTIAWSEYKTIIITQIKNTAIVGYIAVQDLTKAGDMIRNITFESFFPLIVVAIIYFIFVGLAVLAVDLISRLLGRSERKSSRFLRGVTTHD